MSAWGATNPVPIAPIPQCRVGVAQPSVFPPDDTLVCAPVGTQPSQLMTAVSMQNYGVNSYMVRQPFDFAGRIGRIVFDLDVTPQAAGGFPEIQITDDPSPATTYREFANNEVGPAPKNALSIKFLNGCSSTDSAPVNTMVYNNYAGRIITPTFDRGNGCAKVSQGSLNHYEVRVSQNHVDVYGSDFSIDGGRTFANFKLLYSADISLPFARGYIHFNARNHASVKYGFGPDAIFRWKNIGFDGPVIAAPRAYEIPDNTTMVTYNGAQERNLGFLLLDATKAAVPGIYDPVNRINSLTFRGVDASGITSATITMNVHFSVFQSTPDATWGISYRLNGRAWRTHNLTAGDLASVNAIAGAPLGMLAWSLDVPVTDVVQGDNQLELIPVNAPMGYPPVVANIDLLLAAPGSVNPPPPIPPTVAISASPTSIATGGTSTLSWSSTNATSCTAAGGWTGTKAISGSLSVSPVTTATYTLTCAGAGGTSSASAMVAVSGGTVPLNGACGSANGATFSAAPTANLCAAGVATPVSGVGPWTWSCAGSGGGATASCSALASSPPPPPPPPPVVANCGMQLGGAVTFCETFDNKNPGIPGRTGDLDPNVWGVSRATGNTNFGPGQYDGWAATKIQTCNGTVTVFPPNDIIVCNGQLREAVNDNPIGTFDDGTVTTLAMYPKQPFDFAGRIGTVSFDVSNDTHGTHSAWPEFWMSNLPVPAPFNHFDSWQALPQHGFGIRFGSSVGAGAAGECPNQNNLDKRRWTVDSAVIVRNYVMDDTNGIGGVRTNMSLQRLDCVISPPDDSGITNHVEVRISQNQIDVYATDAGVAPSPATLRRIATVTNANLTLTRGLIWLEDAHYNADKGPPPSQREHTFVWDNVAFDGPFTYRDFSYDALDAGQVSGNVMDLGKFSLPGQATSWSVPNIPASPQAAAVRVLFGFYLRSPASPALNVTVNGHAHPTAWPYPDTQADTWRTFAVTVPITDLVAGTNVVQIGSGEAMVVANVNIVLVDVPGGVPILPGSNNAYPGVAAPPPPPPQVNGACGSANGTPTMTKPALSLCSTGAPSLVTGPGPWAWTCAGSGGGTAASCSAPVATVCTVVCR